MNRSSEAAMETAIIQMITTTIPNMIMIFMTNGGRGHMAMNKYGNNNGTDHKDMNKEI